MERDTLPSAAIFFVWFQTLLIIFLATELIHRSRYHFSESFAIVAYAVITVYAVVMALVSLKFWKKFRHVRASKDRDDTLAFNRQSHKLMRINSLIFAAYFLGALVLYIHQP